MLSRDGELQGGGGEVNGPPAVAELLSATLRHPHAEREPRESASLRRPATPGVEMTSDARPRAFAVHQPVSCWISDTACWTCPWDAMGPVRIASLDNAEVHKAVHACRTSNISHAASLHSTHRPSSDSPDLPFAEQPN